MVQAVIFDWGDTLMRDFPDRPGPMAFWPTVEIVDGVKEVLKGLNRSLVCCVASNAGASDGDLMGLALERVGIRRYFRYLLTSKELGVAKPDPLFFIEVAKRVGAAPSACIMVGNDYVKDIIGAKQVGMHTVLLCDGADRPHADYVIHTMYELPGVIRRLLSPGAARF